MWNGVSTKAFALVVIGLIEKGLFEPGIQHLVPSNILSKAELVRLIADRFGRVDLVVNDVKSDSPKDMTLSTLNPEKNRVLWNSGGYVEIPTIQQMVGDISV
jgi:dTDP-4-dehydrorhamnose reductase